MHAHHSSEAPKQTIQDSDTMEKMDRGVLKCVCGRLRNRLEMMVAAERGYIERK